MARKPGQTFSAGIVLSKLFVISGFIMKCESELGLCYPHFCFRFNMLHLFICVRLHHRKHVAIRGQLWRLVFCFRHASQMA